MAQLGCRADPWRGPLQRSLGSRCPRPSAQSPGGCFRLSFKSQLLIPGCPHSALSPASCPSHLSSSSTSPHAGLPSSSVSPTAHILLSGLFTADIHTPRGGLISQGRAGSDTTGQAPPVAVGCSPLDSASSAPSSILPQTSLQCGCLRLPHSTPRASQL